MSADARTDEMHDDDWNGTRSDRLISRIVDRRAEPDDWSAFAALAHAEPAHWEQLLSTLRDDVALRAAMAGALATAETVETPSPSLSRWRQWRQWTGWAAAGVLALCWAGSSGLATAPAGAGPGTSPLPASTPASRPAMQPLAQDEPARDSRLGSGLPVGEELPLRLMGTRPGPSGHGVEVLYVRPVVERAVVDGVYSVGTDELGRPVPVPVDPATLVASDNL